MDFGKLDSIVSVDFSLIEGNICVVNNAANNPILELYIGGTAWINSDWKGRWYPKSMTMEKSLEHYGKLFNSIELNTTYYQIPEKKLVAKWKKMVPSDFKFCPKIHQSVFKTESNTNIQQLYIQLSHFEKFEENLGQMFLQLPSHYAPSKDLDRFISFIEKLNNLPVSIEFRHSDWFIPSTWNLVSEHLKNNKIGTVITDVAGRRDVLHMTLTTDTAFIRFVGNNLDKTDFLRCDTWLEKIEFWRKMGIKRVYFFHHQPNAVQIPEISKYFGEKAANNSYFRTRFPFVQMDTMPTLF